MPLPLYLDVHEDAVNVLPEAPAVVPLFNVSDPELLLLGVVVVLDREDDMGVVLVAALHLAERISPTPSWEASFCTACLPSIAVTACMGWKVQASPDWTKGHIEFPEDL